MTQLEEAIGRYHRLLDSDKYSNLDWARKLQEQMAEKHLTGTASQVLPVLRPHLVTRRQYTGMVKASEALLSAIDRVNKLALSTPALLSRMELLPAEKMLASVDPGYPFSAVTSLLDTQISNGSMFFMQFNVTAPLGAASSEALSDLFYNCPPVKEFRKRFKLAKSASLRYLLGALRNAYKAYGGQQKNFRIAILEFRQPFQVAVPGEFRLLAEYFENAGHPATVVSPEQLEYRNGKLVAGDFQIDLIYRRLTVQEFLLRFDLTHPLVRAYREGNVCVVNSFRAELAYKKAIFDLLTDEALTAKFPAVERKAIRDHIPWTRVVSDTKTTYQDKQVDLTEFIRSNRETLVLRPNDVATDQHAYVGTEVDERAWDRALNMALRDSYVVQERVAPEPTPFPLFQFDSMEMRDMNVDVQPHMYLGKVHGASSWLSEASGGSFSTLAGLAPTFILEGRG